MSVVAAGAARVDKAFVTSAGSHVTCATEHCVRGTTVQGIIMQMLQGWQEQLGDVMEFLDPRLQGHYQQKSPDMGSSCKCCRMETFVHRIIINDTNYNF